MSLEKFFKIAKNDLFTLCRSITGKGTEKTLRIIKNEFPKLKILKKKCGSKVFDWKIPSEWNVSDAYILDKSNKKIVDFKKNNLHLVGYSVPIKKNIKQRDLLKKLFSLPDKPDAIPYHVSYYKKSWGFCVTDKQKKMISKNYKSNDIFNVVIKSNFKKNGYLKYGELIIPGKSKQEILVSTYICHPSMANNELSGPIVSMLLIDNYLKKKLKKTIRFLFVPETIGSLTYLSHKLTYLKRNVIGGYNLSCIGDNRKHSCILSRNENSQSDKSLLEAYKQLKIRYKIFSYLERGSDERQYNSPYVDLGITSIFRSKYGEYPEYHTSHDIFGRVVTKEGLNGGYKVAKKSIDILQEKIIPKSNIYCEPRLSKYGLYKKFDIEKKRNTTRDYINFMTYSDGKNDLSDIAQKIKLSPQKTKKYLKILVKKKLISI